MEPLSNFESVIRELDKVALQRENVEQQLTLLAEDVNNASSRLSLDPEMTQSLLTLQLKSQARVIEPLEAILTAFIKDVLPGEGSAKLHHYIHAGAPALDVLLQTPNGDYEDIFTGNGGCIDNVISTGLRFLSVFRSGNRKFILLDEPDCWVKPDLVPAFIQTVSRVAFDVGIQVIAIFHHPDHVFDGLGTIIPLIRSGGEKYDVQVGDVAPFAHWNDDDQEGIRSLHLQNCRTATDLTINLFPGLNIVTGSNNLGKSTALYSCLKAVFYADSQENLIQHKKDECVITLNFEKHQKITYRRKRKGSPITSYEYSGLGQSYQGSGKDVPKWISQTLNVDFVGDLDIHLAHQKKPVFLLDLSKTARAALLRIGSEYDYTGNLMAEYAACKKSDSKTVKDGSAKLTQMRAILKDSESLKDISMQAKTFVSLRKNCEELHKSLQEAEAHLRLFAKIENSVKEMNASDEMLHQITSDACIFAELNNRLWQKILNIKTAEEIAGATIPESPEVPHLQKVSNHTMGLLSSMEKLETLSWNLIPACDSNIEKYAHAIQSLESHFKNARHISMLNDKVNLTIPELKSPRFSEDLLETSIALSTYVRLYKLSNLEIPKAINVVEPKSLYVPMYKVGIVQGLEHRLSTTTDLIQKKKSEVTWETCPLCGEVKKGEHHGHK